ncbi:MAG: NTP transferase domain-containing protein [Candidatus Eremiobacteraeota bacterium]|nr:NTP transferase domain-containing protein [Candidatus Eremiobacteraeota bacterium]
MKYDAVITAAGRLPPAAAARYATDVKALVRVGGAPLLSSLVAALRAAVGVARIVVVGPASARHASRDADEWIDEKDTGAANVVAALDAARTRRALYCASDLPFLSADAVMEFLANVPATADVAYPIVMRDAFLRRYPGAPRRFARLADGDWTGGSVFLVDAPLLLRRSDLLARVFDRRKSVAGLARLMGPAVLWRFATGRLTVLDLERRGWTSGRGHADRHPRR